MPTATTTETYTPSQMSLTLKGLSAVKQAEPRSPGSNSAPTTATLRSLYNRAAHAFLHRDIPLTTSLINSAFSSIHPPITIPDTLDELRRKWDVLRITLESTVYSTSPGFVEDSQSLLKSDRNKSPQDFLTSMHARSLALFTPKQDNATPTSATLPTQVLITLVYASLRLDCPDFGRVIIEDWLARREPLASPSLTEITKENGYQKVLDLYCLQVLPKLEQWDYAEQFLTYENELSHPARESMRKSLKSLQVQAMTSQQLSQPDALSFSSSSLELPESSSRPYSPAPSTSSSSSSLSTTSTHTVVPSNVRGPSQLRNDVAATAHPNHSKTSVSSDSTATPRRTSSIKPTLRSRNTHSSGSSISRHFSPTRQPSASIQRSNLSTFALIKAYLAPYTTSSSLSTLFLIFVVFPAISLLVRARHKSRQKALGVAAVPSNAALTRQQLTASRTGAFNKAWGAIVQSIFDTVRMAGSGLV